RTRLRPVVLTSFRREQPCRERSARATAFRVVPGRRSLRRLTVAMRLLTHLKEAPTRRAAPYRCTTIQASTTSGRRTTGSGRRAAVGPALHSTRARRFLVHSTSPRQSLPHLRRRRITSQDWTS